MDPYGVKTLGKARKSKKNAKTLKTSENLRKNTEISTKTQNTHAPSPEQRQKSARPRSYRAQGRNIPFGGTPHSDLQEGFAKGLVTLRWPAMETSERDISSLGAMGPGPGGFPALFA